MRFPSSGQTNKLRRKTKKRIRMIQKQTSSVSSLVKLKQASLFCSLEPLTVAMPLKPRKGSQCLAEGALYLLLAAAELKVTPEKVKARKTVRVTVN